MHTRYHQVHDFLSERSVDRYHPSALTGYISSMPRATMEKLSGTKGWGCVMQRRVSEKVQSELASLSENPSVEEADALVGRMVEWIHWVLANAEAMVAEQVGYAPIEER